MSASAPPTELDFSPPASYAFEAELRGPAPRPIPPQLRRAAPVARRHRDLIRSCAVYGAGALLLDLVPGIDQLGLYVLPFAYLSWIGFGCLALAALLWLGRSLGLSSFRYVREGVPLVVRIVELVKAPSVIVNGATTHYAFTAGALFRHPETTAVTAVQLRSNDFPTSRRDQYDTPFRVGDYATALYLPGRFEKSLRLYAFLELSPSLNLCRRAAKAASPVAIAVGVLALVTFIALIFSIFLAYGRYEPVEFEYSRALWPMAAGGLLIGGALLAAAWMSHRRELQRTSERNQGAAAGEALEVATPFLGSGVHGWFVRIALALGAPLMGALLALCAVFVANAWLDSGSAQPRPAHVQEMSMITHAFLFREYELSYMIEGSEEVRKLLTTPEHLMSFPDEQATAYVRPGRFGWPWVESVEPAPSAAPAPDLAQE